jgi:hypothetical protein
MTTRRVTRFGAAVAAAVLLAAAARADIGVISPAEANNLIDQTDPAK